MKLAKIRTAAGEVRVAALEENDRELRPLDLSQVRAVKSLADILNSPDPLGLVHFLLGGKHEPIATEKAKLLAPIDRQEVWAAGVTYQRSQVARMDESASGAVHYDKVYTADRPELFFKATPERVSGPGDPVRVRSDSHWTVPEPEFTLVLSKEKKLVGYTVGNDMSARDIEGENPLYLPQAKVYRQSCALGPWIVLAEQSLPREGTQIRMTIERSQKLVFEGRTDLGQMKRSIDDLVDWLARENDYPEGAFLLTGTGIVPPDDFALADGDVVSIEIDDIGTLSNPVVRTA